MSNKTLGIGWLLSLGVAMLAFAVESEAGFSNTSALLSTASGIGILFFGIWGGIRLINQK